MIRPRIKHILIYFTLTALSFITMTLFEETNIVVSGIGYYNIRTLSSFLMLMIFLLISLFMDLSGNRLDFRKMTDKEKLFLLLGEFINLIIGYAIGVILPFISFEMVYLLKLYPIGYNLDFSLSTFMYPIIVPLVFYFFMYILRYTFSFVKSKKDFDLQALTLSVIASLVTFVYSNTEVGMVLFIISFFEFSYLFIYAIIYRISELSRKEKKTRMSFVSMFISKRRIFMIITSVLFMFLLFSVFTTEINSVIGMNGFRKYDYVSKEVTLDELEKELSINEKMELKAVSESKTGFVFGKEIEIISSSFNDLDKFFDFKYIETMGSVPQNAIIVTKDIMDKCDLEVGRQYLIDIDGEVTSLTVYGVIECSSRRIAFSNMPIRIDDRKILIKTDKPIEEIIDNDVTLSKINTTYDYERIYYTSLGIRAVELISSLIISVIMVIVILLLESRIDLKQYKSRIDRMISSRCKRNEIVKTILYTEVLEFISCFILTLIPLYILFGMNKNTLGVIMNVSLMDLTISNELIFLFAIFSLILLIIIVDCLIVKSNKIEKE